MARVVDATPARAHARNRAGGGLELAAALFSAVLIGCAGWWWAVPDAYPIPAGDPTSLVAGPWTQTHTAVLAALGLTGLVAAAVAGMPVLTRATRGLLTGVAVTQAVVLMGVVADARALSALGYLVALIGPVALFAVVVAAVRRARIARYAVVAGAIVLGAGMASGIVSAAAVGEMFAELGAGVSDGARMFPLALSAVAIAGGGIWAALAWRLLTRGGSLSYGPRARARVVRWGRWLTIAAALGPVPYLIARLTWLTPWPQFSPAAIDLPPGARVFGLLLGLAALGGSVLTIGLIRPWGEVVPAWIPVLGGRVVPPRIPAAIGFTVGLVVSIAGRPFVQLVVSEPTVGVTFLLWLPLPIWGPLLMAASVAYYLRRVSSAHQERNRSNSASSPAARSRQGVNVTSAPPESHTQPPQT